MLSQFIPVEPGSGGGRCCLQGRRCSSRILSNAYGGAVNTTAADGGGFSTVAIDKPIGFLCPNVVGVFSPSELSSTEQSRNTTGMDIRAGPAAGFRGRLGHPAHSGRRPGRPALQSGLIIQRTTLLWALMASGADRRAFSSCSFPVCLTRLRLCSCASPSPTPRRPSAPFPTTFARRRLTDTTRHNKM